MNGMGRKPFSSMSGVSSQRLRRSTTVELNKGECRNGLVRAVNLHRLGRFRDRSQDDLAIRASALNLVVTAISHWNTIYTGRVVDALRARGEVIPDDLLAGLSPLGWECGSASNHDPGKILTNQLLKHRNTYFWWGHDRRRLCPHPTARFR